MKHKVSIFILMLFYTMHTFSGWFSQSTTAHQNSISFLKKVTEKTYQAPKDISFTEGMVIGSLVCTTANTLFGSTGSISNAISSTALLVLGHQLDNHFQSKYCTPVAAGIVILANATSRPRLSTSANANNTQDR